MAKTEQLELDDVDYRILKELSLDGRVSDVSLGDQIKLSATAVARRRKSLEERQAVLSYSANLNLPLLGFNVVVFVAVELSSQAEHALIEFEREVVKCPSVSYCGFVSGDTDFLLMLHVESFEDYDRVYRRELSTLPHVAKIRSSFVIREVARRGTPPVVFEDKA
ncbi:MAG: Lrp/AsnC family transcriptional regulator [Phenylobacterium sp.]|jgi:Lrp/AsnC family transcriptional regulator, leucine-responsive regulatory protein|uniref:Lrp/AsnC family transcriptional regulator n=1 Tax=Phenylobacterium sp. TaxID=1871053 RepID=UPI00391C5EE5